MSKKTAMSVQLQKRWENGISFEMTPSDISQIKILIWQRLILWNTVTIESLKIGVMK